MRVEVLGGVERRQRWSHDDKMRIVEQTLAPGAKVARRNGIAASVVFTWRRQARTMEKVGPCFATVQIAAAETGAENAKLLPEDDRRVRPVPAARIGLIEIDLGNRRRIRVDAQVDAEALARVLDCWNADDCHTRQCACGLRPAIPTCDADSEPCALGSRLAARWSGERLLPMHQRFEPSDTVQLNPQPNSLPSHYPFMQPKALRHLRRRIDGRR
jgi:transposase